LPRVFWLVDVLLIQRNEYEQKVLAPLVEGGQKTRIREALLSNLEGEEELKQSVVGATRAEIVTLFQRNFALKELDASALAGVVFNLPNSMWQYSTHYHRGVDVSSELDIL
jgi:hypothetical protein